VAPARVVLLARATDGARSAGPARTGKLAGMTPTRLTLLAHAPTAATAAAAFPADDPLDARGRSRLRDAAGGLPRAARVRCAPDRACRGTADGLGLAAAADEGLREWDLGRWAGRTLDAVAADEPDAVHAWLADPGAAPHGGEPLAAVLARVRAWLAALPDGHTLGVCGPAVVRAAVVAVLDAPPAAFWRVDAAPLTATDLRGGPRRWTVRATGVPLAAGPEGVDGAAAHDAGPQAR
jgi:broad specificity phosphatase PhoE